MTPASTNDVRSQNRRRVLDAVRRQGVVSRKDIGALTGLSPATISAITADFLDEGILIPPPLEKVSSQGRGRPKVALQLNPEAAIVGAVYFQLNRVMAEIVDYAGTSLGEFSAGLESRKLTLDEIRLALSQCIKGALCDSGLEVSNLSRIAIGFQGVTDATGSSVLWTPICSQKNLPICQWLEDEFNVPTNISNDCDRLAQALSWRESEKYGKDFAALLLAHGVGMGLHLGDGIMTGIRSSGLEFGHMTYEPDGALCRCGKRGCIEAYAGDYAIERRANGASDQKPPADTLEPPDLNRVLVAAENNDPDAIAAIEAAGAAIGTGLASLYALLDRFPVVFVGHGTLLFDLMEKSLRNSIGKDPGAAKTQSAELFCYLHEAELVKEGSAINALQQCDREICDRRIAEGPVMSAVVKPRQKEKSV